MVGVWGSPLFSETERFQGFGVGGEVCRGCEGMLEVI